MEQFRAAYDTIRTAIVGFVVLVGAVQLLVAAGWRLAPGSMINVGVGVVLAIVGNYMGKVRRNFFVGIRTPWTLASEEVWLGTHRVGGKLFTTAGVIVAVAGLLQRIEFELLPPLRVDAARGRRYKAAHGRPRGLRHARRRVLALACDRTLTPSSAKR